MNTNEVQFVLKCERKCSCGERWFLKTDAACPSFFFQRAILKAEYVNHRFNEECFMRDYESFLREKTDERVRG